MASVGVKVAKHGATVVAVPSLQNQIERYSVADHILHSLLDFQPELWGLPALDDWGSKRFANRAFACQRSVTRRVSSKECMLLSIEAGKSSSYSCNLGHATSASYTDEENILEVKYTTKEDAAIAWLPFDLLANSMRYGNFN
ncbi:hypothetical protein HPP92_008059 [Vanilla planifolia]|uniref:Uncharacterized protein n=1 Tax=Vanilla planifolia TaxID=51239 RepID=A0A835RFF2_VANPL|nr:hypothetical protein HPP92_008059 [Vanilla planifolia]